LEAKREAQGDKNEGLIHVGLSRKHFALFCCCAIAIVIIVVAVAASNSKQAVPLQFYEDSELKHQFGSFSDPSVFSDFCQGWNNKTFWIRNIGAKPVMIGMVVSALPADWFITWDYDGTPIKPTEALKVTVSIYASSQPTSVIMFSLNLQYKTVD
jgi:hypothetical protein